jgi:O-antigen/teichoic acid export membrane protein
MPFMRLREKVVHRQDWIKKPSMKTNSTAQTEKTVFSEASMLAGSRYVFQSIAMIRGFVIATVLGPSLYGFWSLIMTSFFSAWSLSLGSLSAMVRQVPLNKGRGRDGENVAIAQTCLTWMIVIFSTVALVILLATFTKAVVSYRSEIRLACLVSIVYAVWYFVHSKLASERKIKLLSKLNVVYAFLNAVFGVSLLFVFGINGLLLGMLLALGVLIGWLIKRKHLSLKLKLDQRLLFKLMRIGFPIMILNMTFLLVRSIDKFIVFYLLGATETGYYGLASFIGEVMKHIPGALSVVIFPRAMYVMGKTNDRREIEKYYFKPVSVLTKVIPILLGLIYINIDLPIIYLLPQYEPSIDILKVFTLGLFFFSVWGIPRDLLVTFNKQKQLLACVLVLLVLVVLADFIVVYLGFGVLGVAIASIVALAGITVLANMYLLWCLNRSLNDMILFLLNIYSPFFYLLTGLLVLSRIMVHENLFVQSIAQTLIFSVSMLPLLYLAEKSTGFIKQLLNRKSA